jgi:hypothetical protein
MEHFVILLVKPMENMKHLNVITMVLLAVLGLMNFTVQAASVPCNKADLAGSWLAVVNTTGLNSTQNCTIAINKHGILSSVSCFDVQSQVKFTAKSGFSNITKQCGVNLTMSFNSGGVLKANGAISRGRDTIIGTFTNAKGNFGTLSAVKY